MFKRRRFVDGKADLRRFIRLPQEIYLQDAAGCWNPDRPSELSHIVIIRVREGAIHSHYQFSHPVKVRLGTLHHVKSIEQARELLLHPAWPRRGPWHEDALYTTIEVYEGRRPLSDAEMSFCDAARESSILVK
jgi:hypothetical protein